MGQWKIWFKPHLGFLTSVKDEGAVLGGGMYMVIVLEFH